MNVALFLICFLNLDTIGSEGFQFENCEICGEYNGGRDFYTWVTLKIKPNGEYDYYEGRHTLQTIKDKGKWKIKSDTLFLRSDKKTRWTIRGESKGRKFYFFNNQSCKIEGQSILVEREKDKTFNEVYYTLVKQKK